MRCSRYPYIGSDCVYFERTEAGTDEQVAVEEGVIGVGGDRTDPMG